LPSAAISAGGAVAAAVSMSGVVVEMVNAGAGAAMLLSSKPPKQTTAVAVAMGATTCSQGSACFAIGCRALLLPSIIMSLGEVTGEQFWSGGPDTQQLGGNP
jgi:hypothetical protein